MASELEVVEYEMEAAAPAAAAARALVQCPPAVTHVFGEYTWLVYLLGIPWH